jgi:hypothetical protein
MSVRFHEYRCRLCCMFHCRSQGSQCGHCLKKRENRHRCGRILDVDKMISHNSVVNGKGRVVNLVELRSGELS